jgi:hypothetical protein
MSPAFCFKGKFSPLYIRRKFQWNSYKGLFCGKNEPKSPDLERIFFLKISDLDNRLQQVIKY